MASAELDELIVGDAEGLRAWLLANHATSPGVWLALTKKGGMVTTLTWQLAVDEALCWIEDRIVVALPGTSRTARNICSDRRPVAAVGSLCVASLRRRVRLCTPWPCGCRCA